VKGSAPPSRGRSSSTLFKVWKPSVRPSSARCSIAYTSSKKLRQLFRAWQAVSPNACRGNCQPLASILSPASRAVASALRAPLTRVRVPPHTQQFPSQFPVSSAEAFQARRSAPFRSPTAFSSSGALSSPVKAQGPLLESLRSAMRPGAMESVSQCMRLPRAALFRVFPHIIPASSPWGEEERQAHPGPVVAVSLRPFIVAAGQGYPLARCGLDSAAVLSASQGLTKANIRAILTRPGPSGSKRSPPARVSEYGRKIVRP